MKRRRVFQFALPALLILAGIAVTSQDQRPTPKQGPNRVDEGRFPVADYAAAEPSDPLQRSKRRARGQKRDKSDWSVNPHAPSDTTVRVDFIDRNLPAFPIGQSKAIVIGRVTDGQAYLSNDKTGVYSVFSVQIEQALMNHSDVVVTSGSIEVEREGGRVKFPSGRIHLYMTNEQNMPEIGSRYVFFLTAENEGVFQIITAYELRDGKVFPLDNLPKPKVYQDGEESTFLSELKRKISYCE
jgi:hypothetical protein